MRTAMLYNFLVEANLIAGAAILLLALVRRFLRGQLGNRVLYFVWLLVAIRLLCPLALPNPAINAIRPGYLKDQAIRPIAGQLKVRFSDASRSVSQMVSGLRGGSAQQSDPLARELQVFVDSTSNGKLSRRLVVVYFCGAGTVLCFFLFSNIRFRRRLKAGRIEPISGRLLDEYKALCMKRNIKPIPVYYTDPLPSACLVGVLRPYIALPLTASPREAIQVLAHEVCHYKGKDHIFSALRLMCCVIHWFSPLVWLAANMSRTDGELACDDRVVGKLSTEEKLAYTNVLVLAAARRSAPGVAVLATGMTMAAKKLKSRVHAILYGGHVKKELTWTFGFLACVALIAAFTTAEYHAMDSQPSLQGNTGAASFLGERVVIEIGGFSATNKAWENQSFTSPPNGSISLENALDIAVRAICDKYGETGETMSRFRLEYGFRMEKDAFFQSPYWQFDFFGDAPLDFYEIMIHSPDGAVLYTCGPGEANG